MHFREPLDVTIIGSQGTGIETRVAHRILPVQTLIRGPHSAVISSVCSFSQPDVPVRLYVGTLGELCAPTPRATQTPADGQSIDPILR